MFIPAHETLHICSHCLVESSLCCLFSSGSQLLTVPLTSVSVVTSHRVQCFAFRDSLTLIVLFISCAATSAQLLVWNEILTGEPHHQNTSVLFCRLEASVVSLWVFASVSFPATHMPKRQSLHGRTQALRRTRSLLFPGFSIVFLSPGNTLAFRALIKDVSKKGCSGVPEADVSF